MTWGVGGQAPPFRPTDPDPGGPRGPRMAPPCRLRELGRVFQAPGLPEGPSSRPHAPHPAPLAGAWMGSGPDPWDTAFLGQLFGKKKKKSSPTLCGEIYPRAVCWGSWALQARGLLGRKQGRGFQATGGSRTPLQGSSAKIKRELAAEGSGGREGG